MYRSLYTGSIPTQKPPHAYAECKGCLCGVLCWMIISLINDGKSAYATLPTPTQIYIASACAYARLLTTTRAARYPANRLRSFIRSSLEYMTLVTQRKRYTHEALWFVCALEEPEEHNMASFTIFRSPYNIFKVSKFTEPVGGQPRRRSTPTESLGEGPRK